MHKSEKSITLAQLNDEPTALATDSGKVWPILEGKDAERFLRIMEDNERKAKEKAKRPMTKEEAETALIHKKIIYELEKSNLEKLEEEIKRLENIVNGER